MKTIIALLAGAFIGYQAHTQKPVPAAPVVAEVAPVKKWIYEPAPSRLNEPASRGPKDNQGRSTALRTGKL